MIKIWLENKINEASIIHMDLSKIDYSALSDVYYFALDNRFMTEDESTNKVILNIVQLLNCWCDAIRFFKKDEIIFLPFDYSDQYIGCLRVKSLNNEEIIVDYGWTTKYEGWEICPSQFQKFKINNSDYKRDTDSFQCNKNEFYENIIFSINQINKTPRWD